MKVSLLICTKDRAASLAETLDSLIPVLDSSVLSGEVVVIDNGSHDSTHEVVGKSAQRAGRWPVRHILEQRGGQALARNTGMALSTGDVIVFTDDDVRPGPGWLDALVYPIRNGAADAVVGRVEIAPHLLRPWMTDMHKSWIASTCVIDFKSPDRLVGANMAFSRAVLAKVPAFDENLGPGALGFGDDTLFSAQLAKAGVGLQGAADALVVHHCDPSRVGIEAYFSSAERMGRSSAYISHHWHHAAAKASTLRVWTKKCQAKIGVAKSKLQGFPRGGDLQALLYANYLAALAELRRVSPIYEKHGLRACSS
jgi:glycosyltransferase involved in cell wall biosynthesis